MTQALLWAAGGTGFTALMTASGAAMVFLFRKQSSRSLQRVLLGFAAGVMIAASMWSLLIPAIEEAEAMGMPGWLPAAGGSVLGIVFLCPWTICSPASHRNPSTAKRAKPPAAAPPSWYWP